MLIRASLCLQSKEQQLKDHHEAKHPKSTFEVSTGAFMACACMLWACGWVAWVFAGWCLIVATVQQIPQ